MRRGPFPVAAARTTPGARATGTRRFYLRWLIAAVDANNGFVLVRGVGPTKKTRSGFVLDRGTFHVVDDFEMQNLYAAAPHYELHQVDLKILAGGARMARAGHAPAVASPATPTEERAG